MLSSMCTSQVSRAATNFLIYEKGLSIEKVLITDYDELNSWISNVPLHNKKAEYIKKATEMINTKHKGIVPKTLKEITALPGVGLKMAHLLL